MKIIQIKKLYTKKKYEEKNKQTIIERKREYRKKNKEILNEYRRIYRINRKLLDPVYKLKNSIRRNINNCFKRNRFSKNSTTNKILGCSFEELKFHLESKWEPWMNWDNYGLYNGAEGYGWDIDHIVPLSSAITEEETINLNHYTNLQPLCGYMNRVLKRSNTSQ